MLLCQSLSTTGIHPLPLGLANWQNDNGGDYFSAVSPTSAGYLIWSKFPIKVYIEQEPKDITNGSALDKHWQSWNRLTRASLENWSLYLPLKVVAEPESSDIEILRKHPPASTTRARAGQTTYCFYNSKDNILMQKMTIKISPDLAQYSLQSTIEHELGHALGIWGHSDMPSDRMYASQSPAAQFISRRDINTLKKIYLQPTKLGWTISYSSQDSTKINSLTGSWSEKPKSNSSCFQ